MPTLSTIKSEQCLGPRRLAPNADAGANPHPAHLQPALERRPAVGRAGNTRESPGRRSPTGRQTEQHRSQDWRIRHARSRPGRRQRPGMARGRMGRGVGRIRRRRLEGGAPPEPPADAVRRRGRVGALTLLVLLFFCFQSGTPLLPASF
jgi:hypothetical protein